MILLDTNHLSVFMDERDPRNSTLSARMEAADEPIACTIVTVEEMLRGWLAVIHRLRHVQDQVDAYLRLRLLIEALGNWQIVDFDDRAAERFATFRRQKVRIGTMDLKIASTVLVNDALLATSNSRDFDRVPQLRHEDWLRSE